MRAVMVDDGRDWVDARRIARNAAWLYIRLAVVTIAGLLAVRVVMKELGIPAFGVYSAVSGVVTLVFFLQWTMELAVRRSLCVERGGKDGSLLAEAFTGGILFALLLDVAFVVVSETVGKWFVVHKMSLGPESSETAVRVMRLCVLTCAVGVVRLPFEALIVSSERMAFFAKVSTVEALLSLGAAGAVALVGSRRLETYAAFLLFESVAVFLLSAIYCRRALGAQVAWRTGVFRRLREQAGFFLKSMLSDVSNMFKNQGVNMLINVYAGAAFNASWHMSMRIGTSLYGLAANFQQAFFPQIVKLWGRAVKRLFLALMAWTMRWSALVMGACALPLLLLTKPVLSLWLGGMLPPEAVAFTRCVAVYIFFDALIGPLHTAIVATGKVLKYNVCMSLVMAASFFVAWACLAGGLPAWTSVASVAAVNAIAFLYRLHYVRNDLGVALLPFLKRAFFPGAGVCCRIGAKESVCKLEP